MDVIQEGLAKKYIKFDSEERKYITYVIPDVKKSFTNPEEKVRAETYLQLILQYEYKPQHIDVEVTVPARIPSIHADLVVYKDDARKSPYIVVECKKETVSEAEFVQAIEQGFGYTHSLRGDYLWVTSGLKSKYYDVGNFPAGERIDNIIAAIPRFGQSKLSRAKYYKRAVDEDGRPAFDLEIVAQDELTRVFSQAHQALWAGGKRNPSEAFDELDKLIFCKLWDEKRARKKGEPYDFQEFTKEDPDFLLKRVRAIYEEGRLKDPEVFREPIRLTASELRTIVGYLAKLNIGDTDLDSKGRAFETFLGSFFRGDFGQYFTPREVVDFIVKVLPIRNESRVLDTSCGSGGFLLYALDKVRAQANHMAEEGYFKKESVQHYNHWHDFAEKNLYGIEISESIARTAKMNMIIHDDGHTNVISFDGLQSDQEIIGKTGNKGFKYNSFDYIITNPPFGSSVKQTEQAYLKNYRLGIKDVSWIDRKQKNISQLGPRDSQSTEVLFIEQCWRFLKPGGRLAVVVPDGVLTNSSAQYVRDWMEEHYRIVAVISLPQDAFKATDAGVKSSVLFLQKLTEKQTEHIQHAKQKLQNRLWEKPDYSQAIAKLEAERDRIMKNHQGFDASLINWESEENLKNLKGQAIDPGLFDKAKQPLGGPNRKLIEKTEEYRAWKAEITKEHSERITELKENLQDEYQAELARDVANYPIFMAIAEQIGYDATGRKTGVNELDTIAEELKGFIADIDSGRDRFFA
ncbi:restriction endonuclease subunit M [Larkinella punicea]|uniref:Restriction endonuclease subunit M n=1 Tax=Larkinella punicea TaxID=2315727 RepID=A0A368JIN3_9BACT|nr:N-6 DNA methylase [Larkinella punicea]RCR66403.1 restriction endonuclease subunit M [Larkinella punicea]